MLKEKAAALGRATIAGVKTAGRETVTGAIDAAKEYVNLAYVNL